MTMNNLVDFSLSSGWKEDESMIKVIGVGGGGCNAVSYMFDQGVQGCTFIVCNTDRQALDRSNVPLKIQMGHGRGCGTDPTKGRNAALESQDDIDRLVLGKDTEMLFITAGMGGGTGTGAAPVIAKMAKDKGILTVAVVTLPFSNEGKESMSKAIDGLRDLENNVDSLLVINNEKLYEYFGDNLIQDAFPKADDVLATAVRGIVEIISTTGYINVDFEDVRTMMRNSGIALMGCGIGKGPNRIAEAVDSVFASPLLNDFDLTSAKKVLVNITIPKTDQGVTMTQLNEINKKIDEYTNGADTFKRGFIYDTDPEAGDRIKITAIATGLEFTQAIGGPENDIGHWIVIDSDYKYSPVLVEEDGMERSIPTGTDSTTKISAATRNTRSFYFSGEEDKPILAVVPGDNLTELEKPAYLRINKNQEIWKEEHV